MGQEEALPLAPAAAVWEWEHEPLVPKSVSAPAMDTRGGMPESTRKAPTTIVFSWEHEQGMTKPALKARGVPESERNAQAPTLRLSVPPPPPSRPASRGSSRAGRPEDDPFLAAYLACTKSPGGRSDGEKRRTTGAREPKGQSQRRFAWARLGLGGLSCKSGDGAVEESMVRLAKLPELDPR